MRVFHVKYLKPTDNRGSRIKVSEMQDGRKTNPKTYGYPYHINPGELEQWAVAMYLGLDTYDDPAVVTRFSKVQAGTSEYYIVTGLV